MEKPKTKRTQISQAQSRIMIVVSVATVISVFCLVSSKALLGQASYQRRLIDARQTSVKQLETNKQAAVTLADQYNNVFESDANVTNIIGGKYDKSASAIPPDGDNARIVLDALPTTYDYPALISSLAKILSGNAIASPSITGIDESASANNKPAGVPRPVEIKLTIGGQGTYDSVRQVIKDLERSIRPFHVKTIQLNGTNSTMNFSAEISTFYQPAKTLETGTKQVK